MKENQPRSGAVKGAALEPGHALPLERLQVICRLIEAVGSADGLPQIYAAALDSLDRALGAERAAILLFGPDGVMRFEAWRGLSDDYRRAVEGHTPWTSDVVDPQPILVLDVNTDPDLAPLRETLQRERIQSLGFIPLVSRRRLIGKLMVYFADVHSFDDAEIQMARIIAGHVAFAVDRSQAEENLALHRQIFANSSEAIAIIDPKGRYLDQNAAHGALTGFEAEDLTGRTPAIHLGDAPFAEIAASLSAEGVYKGDVISKSKNGDFKEIEVSAFVVHDDTGQPLCSVAIERDISERKRAESALAFLAEASGALDCSLDFDATLDRLATLTVPRVADWAVIDIVGDDGRLTSRASAHAARDQARVLAELLEKRGRRPFALPQAVLESGSPRMLSSAAAFMHTRFATDEELTLVAAELGIRSAIAVPLKVHDRMLGVLTLVCAHREYRDHDLDLAEDLGHRAASALDNARLYRAAQESDRRKEEFLAVLAHELRNPLAPIVTSLEILGVDSRNAAVQHRARGVMERQVGNLARLIDDLLDVSRVTRGRIQLDKQQVDLESVVSNAVETSRPLLEKGRIHLTLGVAPGVRFEADPLRLEQVLTNLLRNAAKYTPPGGQVELRGTATRDEVTLSVRDTGVGISSELLPHVFEAFVQGPAPTHGAMGGLGIGLTLAHGLIELHGGSVRASSPGPGRGSEFVVRIPIERTIAAVRDAVRTSSPPTGPRRRALVVDDNQDAANALGEILRLRGHEVRVVHDGRSALDLAASFRPDLVLLDIALPDIDGYQVATGIRALVGLETIRIVAISGFGSEHVAKRYGTSIFNRHLVKPVDWSQLEPILTE